MRRWNEELTKLTHHDILFESSGISVPVTGLSGGVAERVAARWGATASRRSGESATPAITVSSAYHREDGSREDHCESFGAWRAVLRLGDGSDTVFPIGEGAVASDDFFQAIDLCVTHSLVLRGGVVVHGAAFDVGGRGFLAVGGSGSGKSTVAAAALGRGARVVSDDLLLVTRRPSGEAGVETLRRDMYFRAPGVSIVPPRLAEKLEPLTCAGEARWRLAPEAEPSSFARSVIPECLWLVAVDRRLRKSRVVGVDQAEALAWLVRGLSGLLLSGGFDFERGPILDLLAGLVTSCPAVKVRLGRDLLADPENTMDRILAFAGGV